LLDGGFGLVAGDQNRLLCRRNDHHQIRLPAGHRDVLAERRIVGVVAIVGLIVWNVVVTTNNREGSATGSGRRRTVSTSRNAAIVAASARPSERIVETLAGAVPRDQRPAKPHIRGERLDPRLTASRSTAQPASLMSRAGSRCT
jgi:hypothetical protein